ncbi:hypothetical protein [Aeromonas caviae]|uniref:hypothetical protein n=1 Tax=Aeromonas caviae TaxID=648 RepID=UPI0029D599C3|nr:hypothetical protein [Aeromonas caviae]MDX7711768.1 hypothetical protein [Aeromonas caviae]
MPRSLLPGYWLYQGKVVFKGPAGDLVYVQVFAVATDVVMAIDMMKAKYRSLGGLSELKNVDLCLCQDLSQHPFIESVLGLENTTQRD